MSHTLSHRDRQVPLSPTEPLVHSQPPLRTGPGKMTRTIQCPTCGVVLNLPAAAEGRRLKCPKCGNKFLPGGSGENPTQGSRHGQHGPDSTFELTHKGSSVDLPFMPTAAGDLRETFDLPSMTQAADSGSNRSGEVGDALSLLEDRPKTPRRKTGAEARAHARRCPTCSGLVPVGMSICQTCGLDLETGARIDLTDDIGPPPVPRAASVALPLAIVGGLCAATSGVLAVVALYHSSKGTSGANYFIPIAGFGVYASVQFLRRKTVKLLLIALALGALIDLSYFVAMPIYNAQSQTTFEQNTEESANSADVEPEKIRPVTDQLDMGSLQTGFMLLAVYSGVTIFLLSKYVQRQFHK